MTEDVMVEWHHQLNGLEFEQTQEHSEGQGGLLCCSPWGCPELDMTRQLNNSSNSASGGGSGCREKRLTIEATISKLRWGHGTLILASLLFFFNFFFLPLCFCKG